MDCFMDKNTEIKSLHPDQLVGFILEIKNRANCISNVGKLGVRNDKTVCGKGCAHPVPVTYPRDNSALENINWYINSTHLHFPCTAQHLVKSLGDYFTERCHVVPYGALDELSADLIPVALFFPSVSGRLFKEKFTQLFFLKRLLV